IDLEGAQDPVAVFAVMLTAGDEELFLGQIVSAEFHVVADHVLGEADLRGDHGAERFRFGLGQGRFLGRGGFGGTLMGAVELPGAQSDAQRSTSQQQHQDPEQSQAGPGPEPVADSAAFLHPSRVRGVARSWSPRTVRGSTESTPAGASRHAFVVSSSSACAVTSSMMSSPICPPRSAALRASILCVPETTPTRRAICLRFARSGPVLRSLIRIVRYSPFSSKNVVPISPTAPSWANWSKSGSVKNDPYKCGELGTPVLTVPMLKRAMSAFSPIW